MKNQYTIGIDIGGTDMKAVLFDGENVLMDYSLGTTKDNMDHMMIMINALIEPLFEKAKENKVKIKAIGLSIAGVVDSKEKKVVNAPNIKILNNIKLGYLVEKNFSLPCEIDNDGNCFLRTEALVGAGKKYSNIYGVTIGTSIGTAWWLNGEIYQGFHNSAGELAHSIIDFTDPIDLEKAYQKLTQNNPAQLAEEAYRGDVLAQKSYDEVGKYIGYSLANIANIIDPEVFIIGGGVLESSDLFMSKTKKIMRQYIINPETRKIKILKSKIGKHSGAIGAALLIR